MSTLVLKKMPSWTKRFSGNRFSYCTSVIISTRKKGFCCQVAGLLFYWLGFNIIFNLRDCVQNEKIAILEKLSVCVPLSCQWRIIARMNKSLKRIPHKANRFANGNERWGDTTRGIHVNAGFIISCPTLLASPTSILSPSNLSFFFSSSKILTS